jgi:hypothetical protein
VQEIGHALYHDKLTSQYFFRHSDFLHLHPILWPADADGVPVAPGAVLTVILALNAFGFLARVSFIALCRSDSYKITK